MIDDGAGRRPGTGRRASGGISRRGLLAAGAACALLLAARPGVRADTPLPEVTVYKTPT